MKKSFSRYYNSQPRSVKIFLAVIALLIVIACALYPKQQPLPEGTVEICFVDVGQGDASFIATEEGNVLIDAGTADEAPGLYHTISKYGDTLSCFIITHPHDDHMGGALYILEHMDVDTIILPMDSADTSIYARFLDAVETEGADVRYGEADLSFTSGGAEFTFLMPYSDTKDANENSAVIRMQYGETSVLFTGDAGAASERLQLARYGAMWGGALDADILKVGHHGSGGSSLLDYLYAVTPKYAVISCGKNNSYGHPDIDVLERLAEVGAEVYRTDTQGTVRFLMDGESITEK